jgi:hypothetical protein
MTYSNYFVETRWGGSEDSPLPSRLAEIVSELDTKDEEHPDTWLVHTSSGWLLRLDEEGYAYLEDENLDTISHLKGVSRTAGLDLWLRFAAAGPDGVKSDPWCKGPRVLSDEEVATYRAQAESLTLESDRQFFDLLGSEDNARPCQRVGCTRGRIESSVLCKVHHFEQIRNRPCPFM